MPGGVSVSLAVILTAKHTSREEEAEMRDRTGGRVLRVAIQIAVGRKIKRVTQHVVLNIEPSKTS